MHLACVVDARSHDALLLHGSFLVGGRSIAEGKLQELDCFLVLKNVALLEILEHVLVALDQDL